VKSEVLSGDDENDGVWKRRGRKGGREDASRSAQAQAPNEKGEHDRERIEKYERILTLDGHTAEDHHQASDSPGSLHASDERDQKSTDTGVDDQEEGGGEDGQESGGDESEDPVRQKRRRNEGKKISDATLGREEQDQQRYNVEMGRT